MGGPSANVWFSRTAAPSWREDVGQCVSPAIYGRWGDEFSPSQSRFSTTRSWRSGTPSLDNMPTTLDIHLDDIYGEWHLPWDYEPDEEGGWTPTGFQQAFGLLPDHLVSFDAVTNSKEHHRDLGEVVARVAERLGGVVDMCGLIVPYSVSLKIPGGWDASWDTQQPYVEAFNRSLPGVAVVTPYRVTGDRWWAAHMVDSTFLRAWLQHPDFHMIE